MCAQVDVGLCVRACVVGGTLISIQAPMGFRLHYLFSLSQKQRFSPEHSLRALSVIPAAPPTPEAQPTPHGASSLPSRQWP